MSAVPSWLQPIVNDLLKCRVDPNNEYYTASLNTVIDQIKLIPTHNVLAVDSEFRYERKGHAYDPILENFVVGCGGQITNWERAECSDVPIVLRGITKRKEMAACAASGRDFYYIDTGYFGNFKKKVFHRITKNNVQYLGEIKQRSDDRFVRTGVTLRPFTPGRTILVAPPSQKLLNLYSINLEEWMAATIAEIKRHTDREIVVRLKQPRADRVTTDTIEMALARDVHCLVTFSSIAATEALIYGKPAITLGPNAAAPLCSQQLADIESLKIPTSDEVRAWANHLAYCQFTEDEMRNGVAWKILNE